MRQSLLKCPACGAPIATKEGESKITCQYCGQITILDSEFETHVGNKVSTTIENSDRKTRQEIRQLQLTQQLSMVQMQLSNLRTERRSLERERSSKSRRYLKQLSGEEKILFVKIASLQSALAKNSEGPTIDVQGISPLQIASIGVSNKSWGTTLFLACTLGFLGAHRYYVGKIGSAIIQTLTAGGFIIWLLIDVISILSGSFSDSLGRPLNRDIKANRTLMKIVAIVLLWILFSQWFQQVFSGKVDPMLVSLLSLLFLLIAFNVQPILRFFERLI